MQSPDELDSTEAIAGPAAPEPRSTIDWQSIALGALLVAMTLVAYVPALQGDIHLYDDDLYIGDNVLLKSLGGLRRIWLAPGATPQYYPLTFTAFWIEYHLWEKQALGYHLVNVLLHAAGAVLAWRVLLRLRVPGAWLGAALFAMHPVCVESVAWAAELKNVLSLPLALLSMLCYFRFAPPDAEETSPAAGERPRLYYGLSLGFFAAAMLSKTAVAPLPAALLVIYWWKRGRVTWRDAAPLVPFFALAVALSIITVQVEHQDAHGPWVRPNHSLVHRCLIAGRAFWFYAGKLLWPYPLMFFYPQWTISARTWTQYVFPAAALALVVALWLARARAGRGPLAAVLIFAGMLAPVLGFFDISFTRNSLVADHFQYHAAPALLALVAAGCAVAAARLSLPRGVGVAASVAVLTVLATLTVRQARIYHDRETLGEETLAKNPQSWTAYQNLAGARHMQKKPREAIVLLRKALDINPNDATMLADIGSLLLNEARRKDLSPEETAEMLAALRRAVELAPQYAPAQKGLGLALLRTGHSKEALPHLAVAIKMQPNDATTLLGMGQALVAENQAAEALKFYEAALRIAPKAPDAHQEMAVALVKTGKLPDAMRHLDIALKLDPKRATTHCAMGQALAKQGELARAAACFREALQLRPRYTDAINGLGQVALSQGDPDQAITWFNDALRIDPGSADAQRGLQQALEQTLKGKGP